MSNDMNKVFLMGGLGADPELRYTNGGEAVLNMRLATSYDVKGDRGYEERTEWHTVVLWGKRAEALSRILVKGSRLLVEGTLQTRKWQDRSGADRYSTEVRAWDIKLAGGRSASDEGYGQGADEHEESPDSDDIPY